MRHRIHKIAIVCDDVEASVRFYVDKIGLSVSERFPSGDGRLDYVFLDAGGITLELMAAAAVDAPAGFHHISFATDDIDASVEELEAVDVVIRKRPFNPGVEGLRLAFFEGPEELDFQLFERR